MPLHHSSPAHFLPLIKQKLRLVVVIFISELIEKTSDSADVSLHNQILNESKLNTI